jgi:hypothetical protein
LKKFIIIIKQFDFFDWTDEHVIKIRIINYVNVINVFFVDFVDVKINVKIWNKFSYEITIINSIVVIFVVVVVKNVNYVVVVVYAI